MIVSYQIILYSRNKTQNDMDRNVYVKRDFDRF